MIYIGSRYESEEVFYSLDGRTDTTRPTVMRGPRVQPVRYRSYTSWNPAYRLDQIADRVMKEPSRWWEVMDVNNEILNPWSLSAGTRLNLP